jgi:hypothetical protein
MGGPGSGRSSSYPTTLGDHHKVDLRYLRRRGMLAPGTIGLLRWSRGGRETASIRVYAGVDSVTLLYRTRRTVADDWEDISDSVPLLRSPQPLGGERLWLACPGCGKRCLVLYGGRHFRCRRCVGLPYASQHERRDERLLTRAQDIRVRLGGSASLMDLFPKKPKGMHWGTYNRLRLVSERCALISLMAAARRFGMPVGELKDLME